MRTFLDVFLTHFYGLGMSNLELPSRKLATFHMKAASGTSNEAGRQASLDFAQRLFSRNIKNLGLGQGAFCLFLSPDAKVWGSFWCFIGETALVLLTEEAQRESLPALIARYHFAEPFEVESGADWIFELSHSQNSVTSRFEGHRAQGNLGELLCGMRPAQPEDSATLTKEENRIRISYGFPLFGHDYDSETLAFDIGFERFCDENKGCYIGQEVIERVRSRGGQGPRKLFLMESNSPLTSGEWIRAEDPSLSKMILKSCAPLSGGTSMSLGIGSRHFQTGDLLYESSAGPRGPSAKIAKTFC